jgi:hypothetical protein
MNENEPHVWDKASVAHSLFEIMKHVEKMDEGTNPKSVEPQWVTDAPDIRIIVPQFLPPSWDTYLHFKLPSPDGKVWTEQELLAELEELP